MPGRTSLSDLGFGTRAVHPRKPASQPGEPIAPVLDQSSTYSFTDSAEFARASADKTGAGYVYTRWGNPTLDALAEAIAYLEGTETAETYSSGMAAISGTLLALCSPGDRIVSSRQLYGGTHSLTTTLLPRFDIQTTKCDVDDYDAVKAALPGAKLLYCETIGNPAIRVADLGRWGELAADAGVPLVVDNTFASPVLCRPVEYGARIVVHSATKFIGGHHDLIGGVVCADAETIEQLRGLTRELGPTLAPFNAWLCLRGLQSIHLRVPRSSDTALDLARYLGSHPEIERVFYPALESNEDYEITKKILGGRGGGTLAFEVKGGRGRAARFQEKLRVIMAAASLGGSHSLIVHAASVTHTQLTEDELRAAGISPGFCRLSVGLEDPDDLIADLEQALAP